MLKLFQKLVWILTHTKSTSSRFYNFKSTQYCCNVATILKDNTAVTLHQDWSNFAPTLQQLCTSIAANLHQPCSTISYDLCNLKLLKLFPDTNRPFCKAILNNCKISYRYPTFSNKALFWHIHVKKVHCMINSLHFTNHNTPVWQFFSYIVKNTLSMILSLIKNLT